MVAPALTTAPLSPYARPERGDHEGRLYIMLSELRNFGLRLLSFKPKAGTVVPNLVHRLWAGITPM